MIDYLRSLFRREPMSPERQAWVQTCPVVGGSWDGHELKPGQPGQRVALPHRPDELHNGKVVAVYVMRRGAWMFCGFMVREEECNGR
jgi:hypothetical protein